jgi:hypothetical protein
VNAGTTFFFKYIVDRASSYTLENTKLPVSLSVLIPSFFLFALSALSSPCASCVQQRDAQSKGVDRLVV